MKLDKRLNSLCREEEDKILVSRVLDAVETAQLRMTPKYIGFLSPSERALVQELVRLIGFSDGHFYGGYERAERVFFGAFPDYMKAEPELFPLRALSIAYRRQDALTHRDFLGALMGLMIKREMIGDILVSEGRTVVFLHENVANTALQEMTKVGRVGVQVSEGFSLEMLPQPKFKELSSTVASMRFDCILSFLLGLSREKCARLIRSGLAAVGGRVIESVSEEISVGDIITVRGHGKFVITAQEAVTRKGRLTICARKYL